MGKNYDNWERLVTNVVRREQFNKLAMAHSRTSSNISSSRSSTFSYTSSSMLRQDSDLSVSHLDTTTDDTEQDDNLVCFLDKKTGQRCYMVGSTGLVIFSPDSSHNWRFTSHTDSRFREVAEFQSVWWLDIRCRIRVQMLAKKTSYVVYLVFKLADRFKGLGSAKAAIRFVNNESDRDAEKRAKIVYPDQLVEGRRGDGWMELEIGYFYVGLGNGGDLEVRLFETSRSIVKGGLIVEGVEYRPMIKANKMPLVSKQCMSRIVMA